jgi:hypothetical protein
MLARVPLSVGLILGLLVAPPVARARLLCRWTGEDMSATACQDKAASEPGITTDDPCCEQRVQTPLPTAKLGTAVDGSSVSLPVLTELEWFEASPPVPEPLPVFATPPPGLPPLAATRILLI